MNVLKWLIPWEPSVIVSVCVLLAAVLYWRGARRSPITAPWPRQLAWWVGLAIIYVGLHTHVDYYAQHEFFIHRLQHMGLHHMGPFLMVGGIALVVYLGGLAGDAPYVWNGASTVLAAAWNLTLFASVGYLVLYWALQYGIIVAAPDDQHFMD